MATLALSAAGAAAGSALLPSGITLFGTTIAGATIGSQVGALAGGLVDQALFGGSGQSRTVEGPRLSDLRVMASSEGAALARLYGRARLGGQVIWATDHEEVATTEEVGGSGKGGGGGSGGGGATQISYSYFANIAVAICEGEVSYLERIWADGAELDLTNVTYRFYRGTETQSADALIAAREGADNAPAFRGVAYVVFERLALAAFGNRLPQLSFEVFRAVDDFADQVRGTVIIPGAGEFVYAGEQVTRNGAGGEQLPENVNTRLAETNWAASIDQMQATLANVANCSLVVSWFGTDLRAGHCRIRPGVEGTSKRTRPLSWRVGGQTRAAAYVVSTRDGRPAYGGTPSDQTVIAAIKDLKARGIAVALTPFILMDVAPGNGLADPYVAGRAQPPYPWRGRITCHPAPGVAGSPDKSAAAATQISRFVGTAAVRDFAVANNTVHYSGPAEWSFRRFVLHHAFLARAAGGVDTFLIGTELRGLTWVRDRRSNYPFVDALVQLAADVKSVLGRATKVTYAADWSEYFGHQPADGSGDVHFHLDPLWASRDIDAIGIDLYWPLSDWRAGSAHRDAEHAQSIYDLDYLKSNIAGGEGYDWYYASSRDRDNQVRSPITDGAGKPWVFRYKDVKSWWQNVHYNRPGGREAATPTAWRPQSKPIWIMETGCPAVDKGANQPNVFYDPKSSESALPYYARQRRDDYMQRRYLQALIEGLDPDHAGYVDGLNPVSAVYGGRMIDVSRIYLYAWDARPFPAFPLDEATWGDAPNWRYGHWLNGRLASGPLAATVHRILTDRGFANFDASRLEGMVPGYVVDRIMAARDALQPLELAFFFDAVESGGMITLRHRDRGTFALTLEPDAVVEERPKDALITRTRGQETELPAAAKVRYVSAIGDYRPAVSEARRSVGASTRVAQADLAIMLDDDQATGISESWLHETWAARDTARFVLPPSRIAVEPGDLVDVRVNGRSRAYRITGIGDRGSRDIEARSIDLDVYARSAGLPQRAPVVPAAVVAGQATAHFMDLPLLRGDEPETAGYVALAQAPWPGSLALHQSSDSAGYTHAGAARVSATIGLTQSALPAGPEGRWDRATTVRVKLHSGALHSATAAKVLGGGNAAAIANADGEWEVLQFETATLVDTLTYELRGLLRGQAGTEGAMRAAGVASGAPFVLLNATLVRLDLAPGQLQLPLNWRYGPAHRDIAHPSYAARRHAFRGLGRRPLSPVHVRGVRAAGGDLKLSWVRRTRSGGDSWELIEVPLGETHERYEVDILNGPRVVRTISTTSPSTTYQSAEQTADFGTQPAAVRCIVYQISPSYGRGSGRAATV